MFVCLLNFLGGLALDLHQGNFLKLDAYGNILKILVFLFIHVCFLLFMFVCFICF